MVKYIHDIMNRIGSRHWVLAVLASLIFASAWAQQPVIREIDKTVGRNGERITLQGSFNGDAARTVVTFGAARGQIEFISDQLMEVLVPSGTTYENIVVTDLNSGLSAESDVPFLLSFGGAHGVIAGNLEGQIDFQSESGLYDICMCDFDNDGRNDIATANNNASQINLFANTTALPGVGNITFNRLSFLLGALSIHARCGDLNGDGRPDLVVSEGGPGAHRLFVFRNTSVGAGSFTFSIQAIPLAGIQLKRIEIADLDADGKPELIVTNQNGNAVTILVNESTTGAISFSSTPITLNVTGAASTDGLAVEDLNNDGLPELVTSQFLTPTSNIFVFRNTSTTGSISFTQEAMLPAATVVNVKVGDLDGDGKPDIAGTELIGGVVTIFRNESNTNISFSSGLNVATGQSPWGLDFGDIDGDGKTDILVASLKKSITVLNNNSTTGNLNFSTLTLPTTYINRHSIVGDVDGDAKPDLVFTSVDDDNNVIPASKVSVFRNKACLIPAIEPAGPLVVCAERLPLRLTTGASPGTTYEWKNGSTTIASGADAFLDVTAAGTYTVTAISEGGACAETSAPVTITVDAGSTTGTAPATNDGPACPGGTVTLTVNDVGGTEYRWTGPAGYTGTGLTPPAISDFKAENAGRYFVDVVVNGCVAQQTSTVVEMIGVPDFQVSHTGAEVICPPDTKTLAVSPNDPDFSYQWAEVSGGDIAGATGATLNVTASGQYYVKASHKVYPACAAIETDPVTITFSSAPTADFSAPATGCTSTVINFADQSTGASGQTLLYEWNFGDGSAVSTEQNPTHQYSTPGDYTVTLAVSYANGACRQVMTKDISIEQAPLANILSENNATGICPGGALLLTVDDTFNTYQWSTGETTDAITITQPGSYSVDVTTGACRVTAVIDIAELEGPAVAATAEPAEINEGASTQLLAVGLSSYEWNPAESLSDATIHNPIASPIETTIYTVSGVDDDGCPGSATVEVRVKGDLIVNKLVPSKFISPNNGDDINSYWLVENILNYPQCSVTIYDDKGIALYQSKPYNNDWDGTYNGRDLPDGVYYFVIRCDGEESTPRVGSITILR